MSTLPGLEPQRPAAQLQAIAMASKSKESKADAKEMHKNYKGFVAGVFSGVSKLAGTSFTSAYVLSRD